MSRFISPTWAKIGAASSAPTTQTGTSFASGAHRCVDEAAAAEAPQPVAVLVELLGPLAALREDEHELLLVEEQPVDVGGMGGDAADLRDQHREAGIALEEVFDGDVERSRRRMLFADRPRDHRRVGGQRPGVVGDEQRAALGGDVLDPLDLCAEPVAIEELDHRAVEGALDPLRAPPVVNRPLRLDRRQELAHAVGLAALGEQVGGLVLDPWRGFVGSEAAIEFDREPSRPHSMQSKA